MAYRERVKVVAIEARFLRSGARRMRGVDALFVCLHGGIVQQACADDVAHRIPDQRTAKIRWWSIRWSIRENACGRNSECGPACATHDVIVADIGVGKHGLDVVVDRDDFGV
jgi:hypothetical protein